MNPWSVVLYFYGDLLSKFGMDGAAVLVCRIMEANYSGGMPSGSNPYAWCLSQLQQYAPNPLIEKMARDWNTRANPHV